MKKLEIYDGKKTYMYPNMTIATPERIQSDYPAILTFKHVIETDEAGEVCFAIENFSAIKSRYGIDRTLNDQEALTLLNEKINEELEVNNSPTAEERIASALEFQTMMMLPDEEV